MGETLGIAQPVPAVIFGMPLVKEAVVAHSAFHNDDVWDVDFFSGRRDGFHGAAVRRTPIFYRASIVRVRSGNNAA